MIRIVVLIFLGMASCICQGQEDWGYTYDKPWERFLYPQDEEKTWWDEDWWQEGQIQTHQNHRVEMHQVSYQSGDKEVPAYLFRPADNNDYPAVFFQHGRRGLDALTLQIPRRLAARGLVVLAPDLWFANFIDPYPLQHDYEVEIDAAIGMDYLTKIEGVSSDKICVVSHTRGGYITLKALTTHERQGIVSCWISFYPHMQDPNAVEPLQIYSYAPEAEALTTPALIFLGEHDQYQRIRPIHAVYQALKQLGRDISLIVYPGVGRGFDFRPPGVRTFADDLATKDALLRTEGFIRKHLTLK